MAFFLTNKVLSLSPCKLYSLILLSLYKILNYIILFYIYFYKYFLTLDQCTTTCMTTCPTGCNPKCCIPCQPICSRVCRPDCPSRCCTIKSMEKYSKTSLKNTAGSVSQIRDYICRRTENDGRLT